MIVPTVASRMKQRSDLIRHRVDTRQIRPFVKIAINARQSQIFQVVRSPMSSRNDMFNMKDC